MQVDLAVESLVIFTTLMCMCVHSLHMWIYKALTFEKDMGPKKHGPSFDFGQKSTKKKHNYITWHSFCNRHLLFLKITWRCVFLQRLMKCNWICHCSKKRDEKRCKLLRIRSSTTIGTTNMTSQLKDTQKYLRMWWEALCVCVWVQTSHPKKYYKIFKSKHARRTIWWLETRFRKLASLVVVKNLL